MKVFEDMEYINERLKDVTRYKITPEVIVWSLKAMKNNPELTIVEAFEMGCQEWDI